MDRSTGEPTPGNMSENTKIVLPEQLVNINPAVVFPNIRPRWNTNEEIASVLIAFDRHKDWQVQELKIRPPSGSMLLYSRQNVRYRKDGYCWKKRRDGKTIREDHMKLKVQGLECIYGSYVHSAILPTFHRRCYWLLQNPDIVLLHYLNAPYPDNTKLSIPVLSYDMEKKEWTKEELVDQIRPMFTSSQLVDLGPEQEHVVDETIEDFVQQLINLWQDKSGKCKLHKCSPTCDKNFLHSKYTKDNMTHRTITLAHNRLLSMQRQRSATQSVPTSEQLHAIPTSTTASTSTADLNNSAANVPPAPPLILNLAGFQGSNGLILVSGSNTSPISIINNSITVASATQDSNIRFSQPRILQSIPQIIASVHGDNDKQIPNILHVQIQQHRPCKSPVPMSISNDCLSDICCTSVAHMDNKESTVDESAVSNSQRNLHNTLDSLIRGECSQSLEHGVKVNHSGTDNCDTLDGSFSSFPSTDLNLDYLLDLPELIDCPDLPNHSTDSLETSSSTATGCLGDQHAQQTGKQQRDNGRQGESGTSAGSGSQSDGCEQSITDYSPDWCYIEGGTKILVTGPWFSTTASYSILFNHKSVPGILVQAGVLRCFTPAHEAGLVTLQVESDGYIVSNMEVFEYKCRDRQEASSVHKEWFAMGRSEMKLLLTERLEQLEKRLVSSSETLTPFIDNQTDLMLQEYKLEKKFVEYVDQLMARPWDKLETYPKAGTGGMTLLHLAAALGYPALITSIVQWRADVSNMVLEYEVDAHSVDNHACTPMMWACARGNLDSALTLYHINTGPLNICNKDGHLPLTVARTNGHHSLANQIECLEEARLQAPLQFSSCSPTSIPTTATISQQVFPSPSTFSNSSDKESGKQDNLHIDIPPPPPYQGQETSKLVRRLSEQAIGTTHRQLGKRYSVDILTSGAAIDQTSPHHKPIRESNSEPRLTGGERAASSSIRLPVAQQAHIMVSPDDLMQTDTLLHSITDGEEASKDDGVAQLIMHMDTDDLSSVRSESPFIDVEKVSSDDESASKSDSISSTGESKNQMVTLANQIIAAMPERIKLSPAKDDECGLSSRACSESHSSVPSQGSPPSSTFGDDSGISTPMTDSLAFDEYRYTDLDTPASSLSPDSTCLQSPYSPYSFTLDSPPPTTADFTEYFNAPATYMEKDFSQLTLSDQEQRKLYEAAKVIQNAYRLYRDKQQLQQQRQKEIEAAILIQSYYRRYKQYAYFKKMTQAAVLIQNQFRNYYAQKRLQKSREGSSAGLQRAERLKKGRNQSVIIQQRFRSHYQRRSEKDGRAISSDAADSSPPPERSSTSRDASPQVDPEPDRSYTDEEDD